MFCLSIKHRKYTILFLKSGFWIHISAQKKPGLIPAFYKLSSIIWGAICFVLRSPLLHCKKNECSHSYNRAVSSKNTLLRRFHLQHQQQALFGFLFFSASDRRLEIRQAPPSLATYLLFLLDSKICPCAGLPLVSIDARHNKAFPQSEWAKMASPCIAYPPRR